MQTAEELSITLPAEMVRVIRAKVESGGYGSDSDVIREAMRRWLDREQHFATLNAALDQGMTDADAGNMMGSDQLRQALRDRVTGGQQPTG